MAIKKIHPVQMHILQKLLFAQGLRFSELQTDSPLPSNKLHFHIDTLMSESFIQKNDNQYSLTLAGKEFANRMDTADKTITRQAKIGVMLLCTRLYKGKMQYLIFTRKKHPFYGKQGLPTGKVHWGEWTHDRALKELKEETNLDGQASLFFIEHSIVKNPEGKMLQDKFLYTFWIHDVEGDLQANEEGELEWVFEEDLSTYITNPFYSLDGFLEIIERLKSFQKNKHITFVEIEKMTESF